MAISDNNKRFSTHTATSPLRTRKREKMGALYDSYYYIVLLLPFLVITISRFIRNWRIQKLPPGPLSLAIIGHLHLIKKPLPLALQDLASQFGPVLYIRFGLRPVLVVSSPQAVEECFTRNDVILANRPKTMASDHFSYGYKNFGFASYGDLWRNLRRVTVIELFSSKSVQRLSYIREEETLSLCRKIFWISVDGVQKRLDMKYLFTLLTAHIMLRIVAGRRGVGESEGESELERNFLKEFKDRFFSTQSMNLCDSIPILRMIGYKGLEKKVIQMKMMRDEYLQNLIEEVRVNRETSNGESSNLEEKKTTAMIETLLSLQQSEPEFYSDDVIKGITQLLFTAGTDTSPVTMEWAMSLLLNNPEKLEKLRSELDSKVGHKRLVNDSDLPSLPYLRCVVYETLRLYPAAPLLLPHYSSESFKIQGYDVPRGTMVLVNVWAMHRDPKLWEHADTFKPERFQGFVGEREGFKFLPFGAGRRACPGAAMGTRIVSMAIAAMVQCFLWDKEGTEVDMSQTFGVALFKAKPLVAMCRPRPEFRPLLSQL